MLKYVEETRNYLEITGFRKVHIRDAEDFVKAVRNKLPKNTWVQFFDARLVATWQHLYFAVLNALLAFRNEQNISKNFEIEILLYASAQRQIRKAISLIGVRCASVDIALVIISDSVESVEATCSTVSNLVSKEPEDVVLEISNDKAECICEAFGITNAEFESALENDSNENALVNLVIERMALLPTLL